MANVLMHPLGCYEPARFASRNAMLEEVMTVFEPPPFHSTPAAPASVAPTNV
jgi:hypothetical protein